MKTSEEGVKVEVASGIGALGPDSRLVVPADLRRAAGWLPGKHPVVVTAELRSRGHIRIWRPEVIRPRIEAARDRLLEESENPDDLLAALKDRFRPVRYYPSDSRLHLSPAIAVFLRTDPAGSQQFYLESGAERIDVMSLEIRNERLERLRATLILLEGEPDVSAR